MFNKPIEQITESDLDNLVRESTPERKTIDFKLTLPGPKDSDCKEFLYDISSFANAVGGFLIYGIADRDGRAVAVEGLDIENADQLKTSLEERARDGIRPSIFGIQTEIIALRNKRYIVVMHIPKSLNPPHQVVFQKAFRFYSRDSNSKYQIDVDELRSIFAVAPTIAEKIRNFRIGRVAKVAAGDIPFELHAGARLVTHFLPFSAFYGFGRVDLSAIASRREITGLVGGYDHNRYNIDGYFAASRDAYVQVFDDGCIEISRAWAVQQTSPSLPGTLIAERMLNQISAATQLLQHLGVTPPVALLVSLVGVNGWRLAVPGGVSGWFDRDLILPSESLLQTYSASSASLAAPLLDGIWRAAGFAQSPFPRT